MVPKHHWSHPFCFGNRTVRDNPCSTPLNHPYLQCFPKPSSHWGTWPWKPPTPNAQPLWWEIFRANSMKASSTFSLDLALVSIHKTWSQLHQRKTGGLHQLLAGKGAVPSNSWGDKTRIGSIFPSNPHSRFPVQNALSICLFPCSEESPCLRPPTPWPTPEPLRR